jgi:hypothetical protein
MPPRGAVAAPAAGPQGQAGQGQPAAQGGSFLGAILRMGVMWYVFNMMKGGQQSTGSTPGVMLKPQHARGALFDVRVFLSESAAFDAAGLDNGQQAIWEQFDVPLGTAGKSNYTFEYTPSEVRRWPGLPWVAAPAFRPS